MAISTAAAAGDPSRRPGIDVEVAVVHVASRMVETVTTELLELEKRVPAALDGYLAELAQELAGVTVDWVRRGARR